MARLITSGFEFNDLAGASATHPDPAANGGLTAVVISTANPRTGIYHGRAPFAGGSTSYFNLPFTAVTAVTYTLRCYYSVGALPAAGTNIALLSTDLVNATPRLKLLEDGTISRGTSLGGAFQVTANSYFMLEFSLMIDTATAANDTLAWRLNEVLVETVTSDMGTVLPTAFRIGAAVITGSPGAINVDIDDIALNDSTGGSQTSWPGSAKVVLLKPISDNAGGTGWTLGTGTALGGNGFTAVKNTPPVGVADLAVGSDVKQIRNASSNANVNYDANLTTYATAGIAAADTVNVVTPVVATAAPVTTSSKQGTVGISFNPVIANVALGAGGTAGAFWSGVAANTYSTGWKWSKGTTTYAPSVTVASSPVARITQVTASTRIAMVCAMGLYVDYTPAPAAALISQPCNFASGAMLMKRLAHTWRNRSRRGILVPDLWLPAPVRCSRLAAVGFRSDGQADPADRGRPR